MFTRRMSSLWAIAVVSTLLQVSLVKADTALMLQNHKVRPNTDKIEKIDEGVIEVDDAKTGESRQLEMVETRQETLHLASFLGTLMLLTAPVLYPAFEASRRKISRQDGGPNSVVIEPIMNGIGNAVEAYSQGSKNMIRNLRKSSRALVDMPRVISNRASAWTNRIQSNMKRLQNSADQAVGRMGSNARNFMARTNRGLKTRLRRLGKEAEQRMDNMRNGITRARKSSQNSIKRIGKGMGNMLGGMAASARNMMRRASRRLGLA